MFGRGKGSTVGRSAGRGCRPRRPLVGREIWQATRQPGASALNSRLRSRRGTREGKGRIGDVAGRGDPWQGNIPFYVPDYEAEGRVSESGRKQEKLLIGIETDEEQKVGHNGH